MLNLTHCNNFGLAMVLKQIHQASLDQVLTSETLVFGTNDPQNSKHSCHSMVSAKALDPSQSQQLPVEPGMRNCYTTPSPVAKCPLSSFPNF